MNVISPEELSRGLLEGAEEALSGIIAVYKEWGDTPLETLGKLQKKYPILANTPLSYAGRLDPLAEGLMLVLVGEANKDRESYLHLDKTYEVEVLFGIKTDTGDLFGVPIADVALNLLTGNISEGDEAGIKKISNQLSLLQNVESIQRVVELFIGKQQFPYPVYSSKTVAGKPLFQWMNEGRISEIEIPKTDVEIYSLKVLENTGLNSADSANAVGVSFVKGTDILQKVEKALASVKGDFRYGEIKDSWMKVLTVKADENFTIMKIECSCSSGTYMRALAEEIGKKMGVPALAYSIKRTKVGDLGLDGVIHA